MKNYFQSNVLLTLELSKYAQYKKIPFIYISTADLFKRTGLPRNELDEVEQSRNSITGKEYGWSKYEAEKEILKSNTHSIIIRTSTIYTKVNPEKFSCANILRDKESCINFNLKSQQYAMNFVRADNLCKAILKLSQNHIEKSEIYHFTSSKWFTNLDILKIYFKKFGIELKNKGEKNLLPKRFNASNHKIKNLLKDHFKDSNYLADLKIKIQSL